MRRVLPGVQVRLRPNGSETFLVVAPHCDDETLGAGLLITGAVKAGCQVKVAVVTNGDGFTYAVGRKYKRLRLPPKRHVEFACLRQQESLRALAQLGLSSEHVVFLGYPDRGLMAMWNDYWEPNHLYKSRFTRADHSPYNNSYTPAVPYCGESVIDDFARLIMQVRPTHLIIPHPRDAHGDHTATFCFIIHALAQLEETEVAAPQVMSYLVHRGRWPRPRGLHPRLDMTPPPSFSNLAEEWMSFTPSTGGVTAKYRAILEYRSQLSLQARYLLSFVRHSEIFSLHKPMQLSHISEGELLDGLAQEWPAEEGYMLEPVRDTITRNVERGADLRVMSVCVDSGHLYVRLETHGRISEEVTYILRLANCQSSRHALHIRLLMSERVLMRITRVWVYAPYICCRCKDRVIEVAIPRHLLAGDKRVLISAETRMRGLLVDKTAWQLLALPPADLSVAAPVLACANRADIPGIAAVFCAAFPEEIDRVFTTPPELELLADIFRLLYDAEPRALLVAKVEGRVVGYVFAPLSLRNVWRTAVMQGYLLRWAWNWLRGKYHFGWSILRMLLLDKFYFMRSALADKDRVEQRILSLGVLPELRGLGIATNLVQQALQRFAKLGVTLVRLEVRPENKEARSVYNKLGFTIRSAVSDTRGEWLVMVKALSLSTKPASLGGQSEKRGE